MKGSRPEQAVLSRDTDMSKTDETRAVIEGMVDGLNDHRIADIGEFFADGFRDQTGVGLGLVECCGDRLFALFAGCLADEHES